ncbi:hypothetical protein TNIN_70601 [Trichonephila inaurata madagascariensis]|uniref:Uncharacterized protein n=1 Tax=Trichonephila inaurata madagascariensis TaxID=2747483 RepID=A0A8X6YBJ6_9ARAC|nr:hypothetical protein TNIN_70541 [Trichonephila inaurata madagascariensis]GFY68415.1 hypothetical protein TNIN_70601 [Trichonephila inaurata madagascariensis]
MRGLKDGDVSAEARPTFPDVRGQVEDIILGNREYRKTSLWSSQYSPKQSNEGLKDGASKVRKPVQHFLMSVVRLKTLFWEIERRKLASGHTETGATLIYATSAINFNGRLRQALHPFCVLQRDERAPMSHAHPRPRSEGRSCCAEARPTFPDVRGQVEDIILGNRDAKLASGHHPHTARNRMTSLIYATSAINPNGRSVTGLTPFSVSRKGFRSVCLNVPRNILDQTALVQVKASKGELKCWKTTI